MKICSFVPGATEVVAALGLEEYLVGIGHECDCPGPRLFEGVEQLAAIFRAANFGDPLPKSVERLDNPLMLPR